MRHNPPGPVKQEWCQACLLKIRRIHDVRRVGVVEDLTMAFYAISIERQIEHTAVAAITTSAREELFR